MVMEFMYHCRIRSIRYWRDALDNIL